MKAKSLTLSLLVVLVIAISACSSDASGSGADLPATPPEQVVADFYQAYLATWPPQPTNEIKAFSPDFAKRMDDESKSGHMVVIPFICAQDFPSSMDVASTQVEGTQATVMVKSSFGGTIELTLKVIGGEWKIDNAQCK